MEVMVGYYKTYRLANLKDSSIIIIGVIKYKVTNSK